MLLHAANPENQFPLTCSFPGCDFRRRFQAQMGKHERQHQISNLEFKCELCPSKKYPDSTSLCFHKWLTHKRGSHNCSLCHYSASHKRYLVKHVRSCHNNESSAATDTTEDGRGCLNTWNSRFQCLLCGCQRNDKYSARKHSVIHKSAAVVLDRIHV